MVQWPLKNVSKIPVNKLGFKEEGTCVTPICKILSEASKACQKLVKCSCRKTCSTRFNCKKFQFPCIEVFVCSGGCWMLNKTKILSSIACYWDREHDITSRWLLLFQLYYFLKKHTLIYWFYFDSNIRQIIEPIQSI